MVKYDGHNTSMEDIRYETEQEKHEIYRSRTRFIVVSLGMVVIVLAVLLEYGVYYPSGRCIP